MQIHTFTLRSLTFFVLILVMSSCESILEDILNGVNEQTLPEEVTINEPALFPEGVEYDMRHHRFLVSSVTRGTIGAVDDEGNYAPFIEDSALVATVGIQVDDRRQQLLVCNSNPSSADVAALAIYDLATGERLSYTDLIAVANDDAPHFANDVAVDAYGNAYVTDSFSPIIYKVDRNGRASIFLRNDTFQASQGSFGLNGIVYHPDGYLIVAFTETATLYKVPLNRPEKFSAVDVEAGAVTSPDGLYLSDDNQTLLVVNNDAGGDDANVTALTSRDRWKSGEVEGIFKTGAVFPTTATQRGHAYYVLYAHLNELFSGNPSRDEFSIVRVDFDEEN